MLLEFSVKNFRSIRDEQVFTMFTSKTIKDKKESLLNYNTYDILSTALIYGRNASGKSNLLNAISSLVDLVINSGKNKINAVIKQYQPYKLSVDSTDMPMEFKIEFIGKDQDRYVYEVALTGKSIIKENLYFYPKGQKAKLYERYQGASITYGDYFTGRKKDIEESLYPNQLLLSRASTEKIEPLIVPYLFFSDTFSLKTTYSDMGDSLYTAKIARKLGDGGDINYINNINKLMRFADTGIQSLALEKNDLSQVIRRYNLSGEFPFDSVLEDFKYQINTTHSIFNNDKVVGQVNFNILEESTGTQRLLSIGGRIIDALMLGEILIIDEFDTSLHPKLTKALIRVFNSQKTNPNKAQLIIATHDISLLDTQLFRRDQVWIAEKEYEGNSYYYSIADIKGVRADVPLEQWYMSGKLGGIPVLNELDLDFEFNGKV